MKIRALTLSTVDYVLECQKEDAKEDQIIFKLKPLSARQQAQLQDGLDFEIDSASIKKLRKDAEKIEKGKVSQEDAYDLMRKIKNFNEHLYNNLRCGLVGWENFKDEKNKAIKFDDTNIDAMLDLIPRDYHMELATQVMDLTTLKEEEKKK